jgi:hypothetical protein
MPPWDLQKRTIEQFKEILELWNSENMVASSLPVFHHSDIPLFHCSLKYS